MKISDEAQTVAGPRRFRHCSNGGQTKLPIDLKRLRRSGTAKERDQSSSSGSTSAPAQMVVGLHNLDIQSFELHQAKPIEMGSVMDNAKFSSGSGAVGRTWMMKRKEWRLATRD